MFNLVSVKNDIPKQSINHINNCLTIIITSFIYWHETLNSNYSMINFYARYVCIIIATEITIVAFLIICSVI